MSLKNKLKNSFPFLVSLRYWVNRHLIKRAFSSKKIAKGVTLRSVDSGINFFGYYNISPENAKGETLYLKVNQEKVRGSHYEPASIILKKQDGSTSKIAETKTWNWQQGCMLQWMPYKPNQVLFNDYDQENDFYVTKIIDTTGKLINKINKPVNNVSQCCKFALSLNYDRLAIMRPDYGYFNRKNISLLKNEDDGIWYINIETGAIKLIITLEQLAKFSWSETMEGAMHKVNHIDINPSGKRFMFLHRWKGPKGRFTRLITANSDGTGIWILNGDIMTSHCCWLNNEEILSFCEIRGKRGYFKFKDKTSKVEFFSDKMPKNDGHPSISPNGKWIVTDIYPGKNRQSELHLFNYSNNEINRIGRFHQPFRYMGEMRIDLHPKWSYGGNSIFFESGHSGKRQLYLLKFNYYKNKA